MPHRHHVRDSDTARQLATNGEIRPAVIETQLGHEHHVAARQRWADLAEMVAA